MRPTIPLVILVAIVCSAFAPFALAQEITLTGTLTGAGGQPKSFAFVQLEGAKRYAAVTDNNGHFTITNFVAGTYDVRIRKADDVETRRLTIAASPLNLSVKW